MNVIQLQAIDEFSISTRPVARCADGNGTLTPLFFSDHVLDNSNHRLIFDYSFLEELLSDAGFRSVHRCRFRQGSGPISQRLAELDNREEITVFAEALR